MTSPIRREIYISSGRKNGFYTLRSATTSAHYTSDNHLRNLSTDPDKAEEKAKAYFDRVYGKDCVDVFFAGFADFDLTPWGAGLQPWEREQFSMIECGEWPFGKFKGQGIKDAPDSYLLYWSQQTVEADKTDRRVANALIEVCRSVVDARGLTSKFEERRAAREAQKALDAQVSNHIGEVGKRLDLRLTVRGSTRFETMYGWTYIYFMADDAGNVVIGKFSNPLKQDIDSQQWYEIRQDDVVVVKATIKDHGERDGVKQTVVQRPKVLEVVKAVA